jgi:hypothetical protein
MRQCDLRQCGGRHEGREENERGRHERQQFLHGGLSVGCGIRHYP